MKKRKGKIMRRIILLPICCFILLCVGCSRQKDSEEKVSVTAPAVAKDKTGSGGAVSDAPVTAAGVMTGEAVKENNKRTDKMNKVQTVIDITGKRRKLKLGAVDVNRKEVMIQKPDSFEGYAQVWDGHFYYLRKEGNNCYTFYRDQGEKVGSFGIDPWYYFQGCCKYGNDFYVVLYHCDTYIAGTERMHDESSFLCVVDFSARKLKQIRKIDNIEDYDTYLYDGEISKMNYNPEDECSGAYDDDDDDELDLEDTDVTIDGNAYYAEVGNEIRIMRHNLKNRKNKEIFCYQTKRSRQFEEIRQVSIDVDAKDMFIQEYVWDKKYDQEQFRLYIVPRSGGRMKKVAEEVIYEYQSNSHYIFWMDEFYRIHRWNRETQKEEKVIRPPAESADSWKLGCVEDGIYMQKEGYIVGLNRPALFYRDENSGEYQGVWNDKKHLEGGDSPLEGDGYR